MAESNWLKPVMQLGLAGVNAVGATLVFKHSKGEKPVYAMAAGLLLVFASYHIYKSIALARGEEAWLI